MGFIGSVGSTGQEPPPEVFDKGSEEVPVDLRPYLWPEREDSHGCLISHRPDVPWFADGKAGMFLLSNSVHADIVLLTADRGIPWR